MGKRVADMTPLQHEWKIFNDRIRRRANREKREANDCIEAAVLHERGYEFDRIWKREHPEAGPFRTVAERLRVDEALEAYALEKARRRRAARGAKLVEPPACPAGDPKTVKLQVTYSQETHGPVTLVHKEPVT